MTLVKLLGRIERENEPLTAGWVSYINKGSYLRPGLTKVHFDPSAHFQMATLPNISSNFEEIVLL